ncbi:hypothetical protein M0R19_05770 [Candidatus Pacearchaeota archaeon]|nr:hypothetical protein [Candidatus Pacearchaeota archaeon]
MTKRMLNYPNDSICPWCLGYVILTGKTPEHDRHPELKKHGIEKHIECQDCHAEWSVLYIRPKAENYFFKKLVELVRHKK